MKKKMKGCSYVIVFVGYWRHLKLVMLLLNINTVVSKYEPPPLLSSYKRE